MNKKSNEYALIAEDVCKVYGDSKEKALNNFNLKLKKGDFLALLGPNGAGKTTFIGILSSLVQKTSGKVYIYGNDIDTHHNEGKGHLGIVPQEFNFPIFENLHQIVIDQAGYYGIDSKTARKRAEKYLKLMGLWHRRFSPSMSLSGGMKRRLMVARALMNEPDILILDEPTAGVDIEIRKSIWNAMEQLSAEGKTIILTTHHFEEAEKMAKDIAIINDGKIILHKYIDDALKGSHSTTFTVSLAKAIKKLPEIEGMEIKKIDSKTINISLKSEMNISQLCAAMLKHDIEIKDVRYSNSRLEELFVKLTKKEIHEKN